jgi:hypothetical protein
VKISSSKRRVVIAAAATLLVLFLMRPGASRLKARIANSISLAVARPVEVGSVHIRFLPPGFDLENLVIHEDPAFGVEPMLRAPQVTAMVRLTSLVRGRLDIARLELSEPSLNLVRRADGRWNWEALLERTARMPLAPTAKSKSEARPGFPYIEASAGRINFKAGQEKKPYALLNADFALWQESENTWGVRLKAEPLRTDMSLSDAGLLRMDGTWQRAGSLRETPLQFSMEWSRGQLGQLTKLISGSDRGWRGAVRLDATLNGTPAAMLVAADMSIEDFHRYDISSVGGMRLAARCDGRYSSLENVTHEIFCSAPVGNGMITLHGDAGLPGVRRINLSLNLESVPMTAVEQLARRAKKGLPADLVATGSVQGNVVVKEDDTSDWGPDFQGRGEISDLRLQSASAKVDLAPGTVPFVLGSAGIHASSKNRSFRNLKDRILPPQDELHLEYGPFPVALGRPAPAQVRGWVARSGYGMVVRGEGEVSHTLRAAILLGLPAMRANVAGIAQMELLVAGGWATNEFGTSSGFSLPEVTGTVQLRNLRATLQGVNGPIEIASAELQLLPTEVRVEKLNAQAADAQWTGSVTLPRGCGTPGACLVHFNLNTEEVGLDGLREWLTSPPSLHRWYQIITTDEPAPVSFLQSLRATGSVSAGHLLIRNLVANRVSASLDLERGKLKISDWRGSLLGGKHHGDWQIDFAEGSPVYTGSGTLTGISLDQVAEAMHDPWISGIAGGTYQFTASGADLEAFWQSAEGRLQFDMRDGVLPHISLAGGEQPLRVERWQGHARLRGGEIEIDKGEMASPLGEYEVSGTASLGRELNFKLIEGMETMPAPASTLVYRITGTVAEPRVAVTPTPETQARLKP